MEEKVVKKKKDIKTITIDLDNKVYKRATKFLKNEYGMTIKKYLEYELYSILP